MAVKPIITAPNDVLTMPCEKITEFNDETKRLAKDLIDTLDIQKDPAGAGLAAPQIGISKQMCVVRRFKRDNDGKEYHKDYVLVNPEITSESSAGDINWEACLSIPDKLGQVKRAKRVTVTAEDPAGEAIKIKASGFFARVILHEVDHLNGVLFTEKIIGKLLSDEKFEEMYYSE